MYGHRSIRFLSTLWSIVPEHQIETLQWKTLHTSFFGFLDAIYIAYT
jgi:hypothetical protein